MPKLKLPKKNESVYLRFDDLLGTNFAKACFASKITQQDALRIAAQAMVVAHLRFGRIPRDMEVRQAQIGDVSTIKELLHRVAALSERPTYSEAAAPVLLVAEPPATPPAAKPAAPAAAPSAGGADAGEHAGDDLARQEQARREARKNRATKASGSAKK